MGNGLRDRDVHACAIIGAGPAGLTCALFLGRYLHRVLVIDEGRPRNLASRGIHGLLGQHGILPSEYIEKGLREVQDVGVELRRGRVDSVERCPEGFRVAGTAGEARARRVVLAFGIRDVTPEVPGFEEYYGRGIHHCSDCDGYEARGGRIAVMGLAGKVLGYAKSLLPWTRRIVILAGVEGAGIDDDEREDARELGIEVVDDRVARFEGDGARLRSIVLEGADPLPIDALFFKLGAKRGAPLAEGLGCNVTQGDPCIVVDASKETSIPGVYAVGDLVQGSQLVVTAAADGAIAAIAIHKSLLPAAWLP
jgi:thioredoxin reductase